MMPQGYEIFHAAPGSREQNECIPMLAVCFDEFVDVQKKYGSRMPFVEESFIARTPEGRIAAHVGLMPMTVFLSGGKTVKFAGVASVGVHPDFRRQGLASRLCSDAARWAEQQGCAALPLYTGLNHVYEVCGWKNYAMKSLTLVNPFYAETPGKSGSELSADEKAFIISSYEKAPVFPGKVLRTEREYFHSWERMFRESFFSWRVDETGYALEYAGFVAEGTSLSVCCGIKKAFLSPADPFAEKLLAAGWCVETENDNAPACWAGENVMVNGCGSAELPPDLFFSLADKF